MSEHHEFAILGVALHIYQISTPDVTRKSLSIVYEVKQSIKTTLRKIKASSAEKYVD